MQKRTYCVHIHEKPRTYENIIAKDAKEAERLIIQSQYAGDYDEIYNVEVMRQCDCGYDNDVSNEKCEDCGELLGKDEQI